MNDDLFLEYGKIKKFINNLNCEENTRISLIFLIQALFPKAYFNFEERLKEQYTLGFIEGQKNENRN